MNYHISLAWGPGRAEVVSVYGTTSFTANYKVDISLIELPSLIAFSNKTAFSCFKIFVCSLFFASLFTIPFLLILCLGYWLV